MRQIRKLFWLGALYFLLSFWGITQSVKAQTILLESAEIYLGGRFGVTGSMLYFYPKITQTPLLGYNGGVSFRYITEKHFGLQVELNCSERGWSEENGNYARKLTYVELPFLTHIYLGNTNRVIFNLGPKLGYLLKEDNVINKIEKLTDEQHIKPVYYPFDYGITAGIGYNLHTQKLGVFELEVRGYYGLSDVFNNAKTEYFRQSNHLNASVNIAWYIQLTGKKDN